MVLFDQKKLMQWTALLIAVMWLNTCDGENMIAKIKCWGNKNTLICDTHEDCSWNPNVFPTKTGEHKCQTDSENIQCFQTSHRTCSSFKDCGFSYTPLHNGSCRITWNSTIKCQDENDAPKCDTPEGCNWNPDIFPKKSGRYECKTVSGKMQCSKTSYKMDCLSNEDCGFTRKFDQHVNCSMYLVPGIVCVNQSKKICNTSEDCGWNPDEFPSKRSNHICQIARGVLTCTAKSGPKPMPKCSSYKECGFNKTLGQIDNCTISWDHGHKFTEEPASALNPALAVLPGILGILGIAVSIGVALKYCKKRRATTEVQNGGPVPPPGTGVPLLPDETSRGPASGNEMPPNDSEMFPL